MRIFIYFSIVLLFIGCQFSASRNKRLQISENKIKAWAYFYQGLEKKHKKKWAIAAQNFYRAATLDPRNCRIYTQLAISLLYLHCNKAAIKILQKAKRYIMADDYLAYFDIGWAWQKAKRYNLARKYYQKSLNIFPGFRKGAQAISSLAGKETK